MDETSINRESVGRIFQGEVRHEQNNQVRTLKSV